MNQPSAHQTLRPNRGALSCAGRFLTIVAAALVLISPLAWLAYGPAGVFAATVAAALCSATSLTSLAFAHSQAEGQVLVRVLVGMALRMSVPLLVCVVIALRFDIRSFAGFVYFLLVFYLVTLATETWMSLQRVKAMAGLSQED